MKHLFAFSVFLVVLFSGTCLHDLSPGTLTAKFLIGIGVAGAVITAASAWAHYADGNRIP